MCSPARRHFLGQLGIGGLLLTPLAGLLGACRQTGLPEGMAAFHFDRDVCPRCKMVISDRRFVVQLRGGPKNEAFTFDDIGCMSFWIKEHQSTHGWASETETRMWVADVSQQGPDIKWLDPRKAQFVTRTSPMGYNFGAVAYPQMGSLDYESMRQHVLAKGK
jgi:hypothetical protein